MPDYEIVYKNDSVRCVVLGQAIGCYYSLIRKKRSPDQFSKKLHFSSDDMIYEVSIDVMNHGHQIR